MRELTLLLLCLGILQIHAYAEPAQKKPQKKLNLTPPGQEAANTQDPGSATRLLYEDPRNQNSLTAGSEKKLPVTVSATCTDNMGMIYKQSDAGYAGCTRTFGKGTPPKLPGDNSRQNSVGITIGH
jgi:hypothetical protein